MRHLHDLHDSLAAPSPIVPTARTRPPSKEKPLFFYDMPALARNLYSVANSEADSKPLRLLGIISDDVADGHKKDDDVAADLIRRLQSQSPASASASTSSLLNSTASGTGAREMFKAGHRRLRQLAQRQRKDIDSDARADEEARQLSALQREGLLPAPAVSDGGGPRRPRAKKESFDFPTTTAITPSCSNTSFQQSNSRRDVERIGQPWLGDPLERCMLDPLSSGERLSSLDLGDLASFMDTTTSLDSRLDDTKPQRSPAQEIPVEVASQHPATIDSHEHAPQLLSETTKPQAQTATSETPHSDFTESTDKGKAHKNERAPRPSQNLKLFPDSLPPRVSNKAAWRRSKCPPVSNGAQPAAAGSQHALPPLAEMPSPVLKQSDNNEPRSAPASTGQFADTEEKLENQDCDQKNPDRPSSLPMHAINAFPLPAPTRPLPALPESVSSTAAHTAKANPKKSGRASPSPLGFRAAVSPPPLRKGSPRRTRRSLLDRTLWFSMSPRRDRGLVIWQRPWTRPVLMTVVRRMCVHPGAVACRHISRGRRVPLKRLVPKKLLRATTAGRPRGAVSSLTSTPFRRMHHQGVPRPPRLRRYFRAHQSVLPIGILPVARCHQRKAIQHRHLRLARAPKSVEATATEKNPAASQSVNSAPNTPSPLRMKKASTCARTTQGKVTHRRSADERSRTEHPIMTAGCLTVLASRSPPWILYHLRMPAAAAAAVVTTSAAPRRCRSTRRMHFTPTATYTP